MNTTILRQKPALIVFIASAAIVAASGAAWAETNDNVRGTDRDRIATAAVKAVGGGTAVDVERSDDVGEAYEVEVRQKNGAEIDVALDQKLKVVNREHDDVDDNDDNPGVDDDADDPDDADDDGDD